MNDTKTMIHEELIGKVFTNVKNEDDQELIFVGEKSFKFYHDQDCCESVLIDDVCGDLSDLEGSPIIMAEEITKEGSTDSGTQTWTFYRFATVKGQVTVKWHGISNGDYSESVSFTAMND